MSADKFFLPTFSKAKQQTKSAMEKSSHEIYDPATSSRELNPYFKTGEGGMPSFKKPKDDDNDDYREHRIPKSSQNSSSSWRKSRHEATDRRERSRSRSKSPVQKERIMLPIRPPPKDDSTPDGVTTSHSDFLTDEQMNEIGAKMIKAELMGNESLAKKLKGKLDRARTFKSSGKAPPQSREKDQVVLSITNAAGVSRPATQEDSRRRPQDKKKNKRVETHQDGERTKYYPDDGKYDIKQMVSFYKKKAVLCCYLML